MTEKLFKDSFQDYVNFRIEKPCVSRVGNSSIVMENPDNGGPLQEDDE